MAEEAAEERADVEALEQIAAIARDLAAAGSIDETLQRICDLGESNLTHCDGASLMFIRDKRHISTPAYSSRVAYESDQIQYETGEGPCIEAILTRETIVIDDIEQEERWPAYRDRALELGLRSMIGFRLFVHEDTLGALDLYSRRAHAFDRRSTAIGQVFASHAAVAMKAAITEAGLERAVGSRDVIGQAKGILMERLGVTADEAFERLRRLSQHRNRPVRELAQEIAESGEVPTFD